MFRSARWFTRNGHLVEYAWEADEGRGAMDRALDVLAAARDHEAGRFTGMVAPAQIDTCTPDLLREAADTARGLGVPLQIHAAQSLVEFHEITRRHGLTPIQWLDRLGLLGPGTIVGHGIFLDHHHAVHWPQTHDLDRLVASGTAVAHCPTVFQRRGITLETAGRYVRAGVRLGLGTDTYPHNMLEELRTALYLSRVVSRDVFDVRTRELFHAATLGGADLLGRDDVGRLAPGAKADLVMVDLDHPAMRPVRDPLKSLIYVAAERAVRDVWVDGRRVVADGRVTTLDALAAARRVEAAQRRAEARLPELDRAGRDHWTIAPPVLPFADD
jgi:cytosine/adenosine deaminase-related metal-dependent hydrolase